MPPYRDWESEQAEAACTDQTPSILPPRNRDKQRRRAPWRRHQTVLEGAVPLSLNVPMESSFRRPARIAEARVVAPDVAQMLRERRIQGAR